MKRGEDVDSLADSQLGYYCKFASFSTKQIFIESSHRQ